MLELVHGDVPRGENYFGRESLMVEIREALQTDHVLLVAPRRFGKTGAMFQLLDEPEDWSPIYLNVEAVEEPSGFMVELIAATLRSRSLRKIVVSALSGLRSAGRWIEDKLERVQLETADIKISLRENSDIEERWEDYGRQLMDVLADRSDLLLLLDEFPIMVQNCLNADVPGTRRFLHWLRQARQRPEAKSRMLLGGSINLLGTLDQHGLVDTATDFRRVPIPPWAPNTAREFIRRIFEAKEIELGRGVATRVLKEVGSPIPYFISQVLTTVIQRARHDDARVTPTFVSRAVEEDLLQGPSVAVFLHYRTRIKAHYAGTDASAARAILGRLSREEDGLGRDILYAAFLSITGEQPGEESMDHFNDLLSRLENDFYVRSTDNGLDFQSNLLKRWWRERYGFREGV